MDRFLYDDGFRQERVKLLKSASSFLSYTSFFLFGIMSLIQDRKKLSYGVGTKQKCQPPWLADDKKF